MGGGKGDGGQGDAVSVAVVAVRADYAMQVIVAHEEHSIHAIDNSEATVVLDFSSRCWVLAAVAEIQQQLLPAQQPLLDFSTC